MDLQALLSKSDELSLAIAKARPLKPDVEHRIMEKFRLDWNFHSNAIEGNKLTLGETRAFLLEGLTANGKPLKDHFDIRGHDEVITFLAGFVNRKEVLTEATIRELHKILLHESYRVEAKTPEGGTTSKWVKLGEYKSEPNFVQTKSGTVKQFVIPQDTPAKMHSMMEWLEKETKNKSLHPIILASLLHHQFTQIHPFDDGNGRMARILMNLILMRNGFLPVVIRQEQRDQYIAALDKADVGEQNDLITFIAEEEINSQKLFLRGANGQDISDFDDIDKRIILLKQELQNNPKPVELTRAIQIDFFKNFMSPFILRLTKKMNLFDELFASYTVQLYGTHTHANSPHNQMHWAAKPNSDIETKVRELTMQIEQGSQFLNLTMGFQWEGFQRGGLDTFNYSFQIHFAFDKYQYQITSTGMQGQSPFEAKNIYQILPNEDFIHKFINQLAEAFWKFIRERTKSKIIGA